MSNPTHATAGGGLPAIVVESLVKTIDEKRILDDVGFTVAAGGYATVLGANGAGKSTLLKLLATLLNPTAGRISIFGTTLRREHAQVRSRIGLIGHESMLYRDLSPMENLVLFGRLYGVRDAGGRARDLLESVGLAHRADDPVKTFSRGMTQRASIARALMHNPDLLLADEPFAGLDAPSSQMLAEMLEGLHTQGKAVLLVNHDIHQSLRLARQVIVLHRGRVVMDAPSADLDEATVLAEVTGR